MQILPIDLTALVATILGISIVLIPVIGLTARYALKPTVEALGRLLEHKGLDDTLNLIERRLDLQEELIRSLQAGVEDLRDERRRERALSDPGARAALGAGSAEAEGGAGEMEATGVHADPSASRPALRSPAARSASAGPGPDARD